MNIKERVVVMAINKLECLAEELVRTEESYIKSMALIVAHTDEIIEYARNNPTAGTTGLDNLDISILTHGLALMGKIHEKHLAVLEQAQELQDALQAGDDVEDICNELDRLIKDLVNDHVNYAVFNNQYLTMEIYKKFGSGSSELSNIVTGEEHNTQVLSNTLIMPVQRLPRYVMLFADMAKCYLKDGVEDNAVITLASKVKDSAKILNSKLDAVETLFGNNVNILKFDNDSAFRKNVKTELNSLMSNFNASEMAGELTMSSKGKKFSNKRYYNLSNGDGIVFSIKVNKNTMTFIYPEQFKLLTGAQKQNVFNLQHQLVVSLEDSLKQQSPHREMLATISDGHFAFQNGFNEFEQDLSEDSNDDNIDIEQPSADLLFRAELNQRLKLNRGLSREGSFVAPVRNGVLKDRMAAVGGFKYS